MHCADGKLYVLGGVCIDFLPCGNGWIEVFDPSLQTWESLPNPPSDVVLPNQMIFSYLLFFPLKNSFFDGRFAKFDVYNVTTRCWTTLVPSVHKIYDRFPITENTGVVAADNTLYWAFLYQYDDDY